jgi:PAS domain S-box-containing protein
MTFARNKEVFQDQVKLHTFDLIISDFTIPGYNGMAALAKAKEAQPETPFIFVSGTIGEERAVEGLKSGATDYVLKDNLQRLGPAAERAIREAREHRARMRAEQALKESEGRFRQVAENIDEVFRLIDVGRNEVLYINPAYEKIWKRSRASLYEDPQTWFAAIHPEDRERIGQATLLKMVNGTYDETFRIVRPDGSIRWIRERACPVQNEQGEVYRVVGTAGDVTERRQLEERLLQSQKMECIGQLASGVAHNFNNVLAVIRANAELALLKSGSLENDFGKCLDQITTGVDRAANLTRQLLTLGRKQAVQLRPLELQVVIRDLAKMLAGVIGENIEMRFSSGPGTAFVQADLNMLEQVILNLVVNARDAMPHGGEVRIAIETACPARCALAPAERTDRPFYCLSVSDTGTGISPEHLPHIFEPFFTTKEPGKGTGLGLATVYGIIKQHAGWVEVSSRVGAGTIFNIFLPAAPVPTTARESSRPAVQEPPCGGETILLVEDDASLRMVYRQLLEIYGYHVFESASGDDALKTWKSRVSDIDLLLTDMVMPGISGAELAKRLRAEAPELRVILMSGYSAEVTRKALPCSGEALTHFLPKPSSASALIQSVQRCLNEQTHRSRDIAPCSANSARRSFSAENLVAG